MKRKGFDHWLGAYPLEQAANEAFIDGIYPSLRMGDDVAKSLVIARHMRLTFAICTHYCGKSFLWEPDEVVSVALLALVKGVEMISEGALDKHKPKPNVSGYLSRTVSGKLNRFRNEVSKRRTKEMPETGLKSRGDYIHRFCSLNSEPLVILQYRELLALVFDSVKTDRDRQIVQMKLSGCTSKEVGEAVGITGARVDQIWYKVRQNLEGKEWTGTNTQRSAKSRCP